MKEVLNSMCSIVDLKQSASSELRSFGYALNKKRAKAKLLKGAKRDKNLEVEVKTGCVNLRFSDGSFFEVVMPIVNEWQENLDTIIDINGHEIKVIEADKGLDASEKCVDTKLTVMYNEEGFVIHCYNTTQNLMIQGKH